jgi:hypothetical protein
MAEPPLFLTKSATACTFSLSMSLSTNLAPCCAKSSAAAFPTPCPAPVMMATCNKKVGEWERRSEDECHIMNVMMMMARTCWLQSFPKLGISDLCPVIT